MATSTEMVINPNKIQSFFAQLETRKTLLTTITDLHKALITHFTTLSQTLAQKSQTLDTQIQSFNTQSKRSLESLENRQNSIPECESLASARISERKTLALLDLEGDNECKREDIGEVLRLCCRRMDGCGLMRFMLVKRKESVVLREELTMAVEEAVDVLGLVLEVVEEFVGMKVEGKVGMADRRWACGLLIQVAVPLEGVLVARSLKERAMRVLEKWKGVLGGGDGVGAGEASMFLQMVIGFGVKERFEEGFLRKLVLEFAGRRDMPKLALALGFVGDKMGDVIDELVKSGKEIEAVYFSSESGMTARFSPISLLKSCLKTCRKSANAVSKSGNFSAAAVEEANNLELNTTRAIIRCVEDHKLESEFSLDNLKKRVSQLERAKAEKKRSTPSTSKPSSKRSYGGSSRGGPSSRPPKAGRFSNNSPTFRQRNHPKSHQVPPARFAAQYDYPDQTLYEGPSAASHVAKYGGAHGQSPVSLPPHYPYAPPDVGAGGARGQSPVSLPPRYPYAPPDVGAGGARAGAPYLGQGSYGGQSSYAAYDYPPAGPPTYPPSYL